MEQPLLHRRISVRPTLCLIEVAAREQCEPDEILDKLAGLVERAGMLERALGHSVDLIGDVSPNARLLAEREEGIPCGSAAVEDERPQRKGA